MGDSLQELADATMEEMRQATQLARETQNLATTAPTTDHFAHRAEEAERAEESIRTAMFDEMEVDYTVDEEIEALGAKVVLDVMEADAHANTILPPTSKREPHNTRPRASDGPREARPIGQGKQRQLGCTTQQRLNWRKGLPDDGAGRPSPRQRSPGP